MSFSSLMMQRRKIPEGFGGHKRYQEFLIAPWRKRSLRITLQFLPRMATVSSTWLIEQKACCSEFILSHGHFFLLVLASLLQGMKGKGSLHGKPNEQYPCLQIGIDDISPMTGKILMAKAVFYLVFAQLPWKAEKVLLPEHQFLLLMLLKT